MPRAASVMARMLRFSRLLRFEYWPSSTKSRRSFGRHCRAPIRPSRISLVVFCWKAREVVAK
jgi:hypothetical protein